MATSVTQPLLETIEADDPASVAPVAAPTAANASSNARGPVILTPTNRAAASTTPADMEAGL